jgi:hypothetical protein
MERMKDIPISTVVCTYNFIAIPYQIGEQYTIFMNIISFILAIAGVAAVVYGIYRYISARVVSHIESSVESIMKKKEKEIVNYGSGNLFLNLGHNTWVTYETTKERRHLEMAVSLTEKAYSIVSKLDERETRNELLKCHIMNNLGYYLAERGEPEDREFARDCAQFIRDKIQKHPDKRKIWQDTYNYIFTKYPLSEDALR